MGSGVENAERDNTAGSHLKVNCTWNIKKQKMVPLTYKKGLKKLLFTVTTVIVGK